jgi:uncharacterized membrane protein YcaP (DUF421 family)
MHTWIQIFGAGPNLTWAQECARGAVIFVFGLIMVRVSGRRSFGRWSPLDIVVSIVVGSSLSRALTGSAALAGTLLAVSLIMVLHWLLARASARWVRLAKIVEGVPIEIGRDGTVDPATLAKQSISEIDLAEALRQGGVGSLSETRVLTLEPSGRITVLRPAARAPAQAVA